MPALPPIVFYHFHPHSPLFWISAIGTGLILGLVLGWLATRDTEVKSSRKK